MPRTRAPIKSREDSERMFKKYEPFLRRISHSRKFLYDGDAGEAYSVCCEKFVTAYKDWDPERGKFITLLYLKITTSDSDNRSINNGHEPIDPDTLSSDTTDPERTAIVREALGRMSFNARVLSSLVLCPRAPLPHKLNSARRAVKDTALQMGMDEWSVLSSWKEVRTTAMEVRRA